MLARIRHSGRICLAAEVLSRISSCGEDVFSGGAFKGKSCGEDLLSGSIFKGKS